MIDHDCCDASCRFGTIGPHPFRLEAAGSNRIRDSPPHQEPKKRHELRQSAAHVVSEGNPSCKSHFDGDIIDQNAPRSTARDSVSPKSLDRMTLRDSTVLRNILRVRSRRAQSPRFSPHPETGTHGSRVLGPSF